MDDSCRQKSGPTGCQFASSKPACGAFIAPARRPPLWEDCGDAQIDHGVHIEPKIDTIVGGLHLVDKSDEVVTRIVGNFAGK